LKELRLDEPEVTLAEILVGGSMNQELYAMKQGLKTHTLAVGGCHTIKVYI